jgi:hypothetical protein
MTRTGLAVGVALALLVCGGPLTYVSATGIKVVEGHLAFDTWDEFSETVKLLTMDHEPTKDTWEKQYEGFRSLRTVFEAEKQETPIDDDVFLSLLDTDGIVEVAGTLYQFDFKARTARVSADRSIRNIIDEYPMEIDSHESTVARSGITLTCIASRFNIIVYKSATSKVKASSSITTSNTGQFTYRLFDDFGGFTDWGPFTVGPQVKTGTKNVLTLAYCAGTACSSRAFVDVYAFGTGGGQSCSDYLP